MIMAAHGNSCGFLLFRLTAIAPCPSIFLTRSMPLHPQSRHLYAFLSKCFMMRSLRFLVRLRFTRVELQRGHTVFVLSSHEA